MAEQGSIGGGFESRFIGGPFSGSNASLAKAPSALNIGGHRYVAIVDPDTGEFLGAYYYTGLVL